MQNSKMQKTSDSGETEKVNLWAKDIKLVEV